MVKKLFKHEFIAYARVMAIVYSILLTIAAATRIILIFESDTTAYEIISTFSLVIYAFSIVAAFLFSLAMGITRFYKNLFTSEGYLSFTLPVTAGQHIAVKAVTAVSIDWITLIMVALSACIVIPGEALTEIWRTLIGIPAELYKVIGIHSVLVGGECVILLLAASFSSVMLYYTFISIGQLSKKNRILAAVGAYFVFYIISQVVSTVLTILLSAVAMSGIFVDIAYWIYLHPIASVHIFMWGAILLTTIFVLIEFLVIRWIITKKLNLE